MALPKKSNKLKCTFPENIKKDYVNTFSKEVKQNPRNLKDIEVINKSISDLDEQIDSMIVKSEDVFSCNVCGTTMETKQHIKNHIEAKHIEDKQISKHCGDVRLVQDPPSSPYI